MTQRHAHHSRVVTRFVKIPEPLPDGKIRCPGCSRILAPTKNNGIRVHKDSYGDPCPVTGGPGRRFKVVGDDPEPVTPSGRTTRDIPPVIGACHECGKWLPGERRYCGACLVKRGR